MTRVSEIVERLEKLTGPDRRLDGDIASALKLFPQDGREWLQNVPEETGGHANEPGYFFTKEWRGDERWPAYRAPQYTESIDAALTLAKAASLDALELLQRGLNRLLHQLREGNWKTGPEVTESDIACFIAIAALRALEAKKEER